MKKAEAFKIAKFAEEHYDYVSQEDWFDFCDMVLGMVVEEANGRGYARELVEKHPALFQVKGA